MNKANNALVLPKMETQEPEAPTRMVAFRFHEETIMKLAANAKAARCNKTEMLEFLIDAYYVQHVSNIPRPLKRRPT